MEELIEKLEQLKEEISRDLVVIDYLEEKKKVLNDKELTSKIERYQQTRSDTLKKEIESSPSFLVYKEKETNVNLLILGINQKFKQLNPNFDCRR